MQTQIPLLQSVRVASPCHADWEGMETVEGERVKFCISCSKNVYNLSAMSQSEAESLLLKHEGRLCVRYYRRSDGTILTNDCRNGANAVRLSLLRRSVMAAGLVGLLVASMAGLNYLQTPTPATPVDVPATNAHGTQGAVYQIPLSETHVHPIIQPITRETYTMGIAARPVKIEMGDIASPPQELAAERAREAEEAKAEEAKAEEALKQAEKASVEQTSSGSSSASDSSDEAILKDKAR